MKFTGKSLVVSGLMAALLVAVPANAEPGKAKMIPAEAFGQLPAMSAATLSSDGSYLAYKTPSAGRTFVVVMDRATSAKTALPPISEAEIAWYRWVSDHGLVISYGFENNRVGVRGSGPIRETRLAYFDASNGKFSWVVKEQGAKYSNTRLKGDTYTAQFQDRIIDFLPEDPENVLQAIDSDWDGDYEVRRLNVTNGRFSVVNEGTRGVQHWLTDRDHEVRFGFGVEEGLGHVSRYRTSTGTWVDADTLAWRQKGYYIVAFTEDPAVAYVAGPTAKGTNGLLKMNVDTSEVVETVFADDVHDVDGMLYASLDSNPDLPAMGKPVAVTFTADMPEKRYIDDSAAKLQATVDKLLKGSVNTIVSQVPSQRLYLILAQNNTDAGIYYMLDLKNKSLDALAERMPGLTPEHMSATKAVSYTARDGATIPAYLTLPQGSDGKNLPSIVLVHPTTYGRDDMQFDTWVQFLASRGYAVLQPNFRGLDGFGRAHAAAGYHQWGGIMQHDVDDAAKWLRKQGISAEGRTCIMGQGYGGYVAALSAAVSHADYACAIAINGIMDLPAYISQVRYQFVGGKANADGIGLEGSDPKTVSPYDLADSAGVPLLLIAAKDDAQVDAGHSENMFGKLKSLGKPVEYLELEDGGHELDNASARIRTLNQIEDFLGKQLWR